MLKVRVAARGTEMGKRIASISALAWLSFAAPANAAVLQPTNNWDVDYGDTQCTAARSFGSPSDPIVLGIVPSFDGDTYKLIVSVQRTGPQFAQEMQGTVDFGHDKIKTWMLHYGAKGVKMSAYQLRVSAAAIEQANQASTVDLQSESGAEFKFALSDMPALLDALRKCTTDLREYWNIDKPAAPLKKGPVGDIRSVFRPEDYPTDALMKDQEGTVQYELLVDEKGAVAGCDVHRQSGIALLDIVGCQVIQERLKFSPAIDAQGKAVRVVVTTPPISWKVAKPSPGAGPYLTGRPISI